MLTVYLIILRVLIILASIPHVLLSVFLCSNDDADENRTKNLRYNVKILIFLTIMFILSFFVKYLMIIFIF